MKVGPLPHISARRKHTPKVNSQNIWFSLQTVRHSLALMQHGRMQAKPWGLKSQLLLPLHMRPRSQAASAYVLISCHP